MPASRRFVTLVVALALSVSGASAATAADHRSYPGSKPTWATPANDVGAAPDAEQYTVQLQFDLRDEAGAERLANAVSTPGSRQYRQYLSPSAWIGRFSPTKQAFATAVVYARSHGLAIVAAPKDRLFLNVRGTSEQIGAAFSTTLRTYAHAGHRTVAPSTAPRLPMSVALTTRAVALTQIRHAIAAQKPGTRSTAGHPVVVDAPCSVYWGQHSVSVPAVEGHTRLNTANCGYTGRQLRTAYGATGDGAGQRIGEIIWNPTSTILRDANRQAAHTGTPPLTTLTQLLPSTRYDVEECGDTSIEEALDIETMHGLAPKAGIVLSGAADCGYGVDAALSKLLDDRLVSVVSNSYGFTGGEPPVDQVQAETHQFLLAAAVGVGLYYASGDYGDNTVFGVPATANYYATSPWVTGVGGTATEIGRDGRIVVQSGWGRGVRPMLQHGGSAYYGPEEYEGGANGGTSVNFAEPWYQRGVVPGSVAKGMRAVPDIAAEADIESGFFDGWTEDGEYLESPVGGTSLATPIIATEVALVQQRTGCALGFLNPLLYRLQGAHSQALIDVADRDVDVAITGVESHALYASLGGRYTSLLVDRGWDSVTGLGTLSVAGLIATVG